LVGCLTTGIMMPGLAGAVDVGTLDDFENGGTMGWRKGANSTSPPTNINTGGPQGAGDNYLQSVSTGGAGADSKQVIFNTAQWAGDYITAGVSEIAMDFRNSGGSTLHMRIALKGGAGVASWFSSTQAIQIPADSNWHPAAFGISESDLTRVTGAQNYAAALASVTEVRILVSQMGPDSRGDSIASTLGVDNIEAKNGSLTPTLYGIDNAFLSTINSVTGSLESSVTLTVPGDPFPSSASGLAVNPVSNEMYAVTKLLSLGDQCNQNLVKINPYTGIAEFVGRMNQPIASLAFDSNGVLYAVSDDNAGGCAGASLETLFTVNLNDASLTLFQVLGNGDDGEAIAFNPNDGLMYHLSGNGAGLIFESINLTNGAVTPIPLSGDSPLNLLIKTCSLGP